MNVDDLDYEQIVAAHHEPLYRFAFSLAGNPDDAAELTQETYVRLLTKGGQLRDRSKVKTWLFTTLYRIFLGWRRHATRFPHFEISAVEPELPHFTPASWRIFSHFSLPMMPALLSVFPAGMARSAKTRCVTSCARCASPPTCRNATE